MGKEEEAVQATGETVERALAQAAQGFERELTRILKSGEDGVERLARRIAEVLASAAIDGALGSISDGLRGDARPADGGLESVNQLAVAIAKAARRGARFA